MRRPNAKRRRTTVVTSRPSRPQPRTLATGWRSGYATTALGSRQRSGRSCSIHSSRRSPPGKAPGSASRSATISSSSNIQALLRSTQSLANSLRSALFCRVRWHSLAEIGEDRMSLLILVVDDEPDIEELFRQRFRRDLRDERFTMEFAYSASAALDRITDAGEASLILILSDINMPEMSGLEFLPRAKALRPDVPVITITAYGDAETKRKALENGAEALLTKPIDFATLRPGTFRVRA